MGKLSGKSAIVTGASKGIGAAIARALANEGAAVVVNYSSSREGADKVVAEITGKGGRAIAVQADVGKAADVQRLFGVAKETFGPIDILVNNAGVYQFDALEQVSDTEFHRQFGANVLGPLLATQAALPQFGNKGGTVINVSSIASEKSMPAASVYSASKAAVDAITRSLAAELGPRGV
ncbi:MAG TPA: SDR family NAD(P)-dependent oxidoreductase, partial [Hyphomonadaceae bacterium]|nr:SDR family NAD(P)-dependent oxidoreductase [Hyphomonadaceae bacterium]